MGKAPIKRDTRVKVESEKPMRRWLLAAGLAAALAAPAGAEVSDTGVFGYWTTFAGVATDGKPVCGMSTDWQRGGATVGSFMVKYFGGDGIVVHIGKVGWQVPEDQRVTVLMQVDRAPAMRVQARGGTAGGVSALEFAIASNDTWAATGKNAVEEFVKLLANGRQITVSFPDGSEPPWLGHLDGARAALQSFMACGTTIDAANNRAPGTTQPFSRGEAPKPATTVTQPFQRL
jgi:hypothetical protein